LWWFEHLGGGGTGNDWVERIERLDDHLGNIQHVRNGK